MKAAKIYIISNPDNSRQCRVSWGPKLKRKEDFLTVEAAAVIITSYLKNFYNEGKGKGFNSK